MRKCPACGYDNAASGNCGVCGRGLSDVQDRAVTARKPDRLMPALAVFLLFCALAAFFLTSRRTAPPAPAEGLFSDEAGFGYEGVLYSLAAMEGLRFLPQEDKLRVLPLMRSRDERVAYAAAGLAGAWLRSGDDPELAASLTAALLEAAGEGSVALRKLASSQLALAIPAGLNPASFSTGLRAAVSSLISSGDEELRSSGFFLAAAAGFSDFSGEMLEVLRYDPSSPARLAAACALDRLGDREGHALLLALAAGGDEELAGRAAECLSYSKSGGKRERPRKVSEAGPAGQKTR